VSKTLATLCHSLFSISSVYSNSIDIDIVKFYVVVSHRVLTTASLDYSLFMFLWPSATCFWSSV